MSAKAVVGIAAADDAVVRAFVAAIVEHILSWLDEYALQLLDPPTERN